MLDSVYSLSSNAEPQELEESEAWIREKSSILGAQGYGKDLSSVLKLLQKHKTLAGELLAHRSLLQVCATTKNSVKFFDFTSLLLQTYFFF